jgi:hypothetical protein
VVLFRGVTTVVFRRKPGRLGPANCTPSQGLSMRTETVGGASGAGEIPRDSRWEENAFSNYFINFYQDSKRQFAEFDK